ncbi:MAG: hypothetical protein R3332_14015, partial [Pseudohongiellaceae bacterium]|nr:hypothetical protein [Pseudohongiellaceae bacterium]
PTSSIACQLPVTMPSRRVKEYMAYSSRKYHGGFLAGLRLLLGRVLRWFCVETCVLVIKGGRPF